MNLELRQSLFWDIDINNIDLEQHRQSIILRITQRGRYEEFKKMLAYYGKETVCTILLNARYLDKTTLSFCSVLFDKPKNTFRCYKLAQSNPQHWDY